jgi:hypothetical protein
MKIIDIFNLPRKSSFTVKEVLTKKDWGRSLFPLYNNLNVDWDMFDLYANNIEAYKVTTELNEFHMIFMDKKPLILVNYDKVMQMYIQYCVDEKLYDMFTKILLSFSDLSYCNYFVDKDIDVILPNEDKYYETYGDID